jgi:Uma2 family endonuclease
MNEHFAPPRRRLPTQAAEGLPRWRWTVAEVERVAAAGMFTDQDQFELVGGEMVPMSPEGRRHITIRGRLGLWFSGVAQSLGSLMVISEPQFNLSGDTYLKPDLLIHPISIGTYDLHPFDALLVIEIADTSLRYDVKTKLPLYAAHAVPEYWVIQAATLVTAVYRRPSGGGYAVAEEVAPDARVVPSLVPQLAVSMNDLLPE